MTDSKKPLGITDVVLRDVAGLFARAMAQPAEAGEMEGGDGEAAA